jgi:glutaredoxin-related protein
MAKDLLALCNVTFTEQRLGVDFTVNTLKTKFPDAKSFPIIVVDGFFIGGYNQLREHLESNNDYRKFLIEG